MIRLPLLYCLIQFTFLFINSSIASSSDYYAHYGNIEKPDTVPINLCGDGCSLDIYVGQSNAGRTFNVYDQARDIFLSNLGSYTGNWDCYTSAATGATSINLHIPGGQLFAANDSILRSALDTKLAAGCITVYPTIHWWQGESDLSSNGIVTYPDKFNQMYAYYSSLFGTNFRMFIYEVNDDLVTYDDDLNNFFANFASQNSNVTFVNMPANVTYNNPPLNNHPSQSVLLQLLENHFNNKLNGDCGTPWTGYPATTIVNVRSKIWDDLDGDGKQDLIEPPIAGVPVHLLDLNNNVVATTISDTSGLAIFNDVPQLTSLSMKYILPSNYNLTQKNIGPNFLIDSDVNPHNAQSDFFTTSDVTSTILDIDCGMLSPSVVETRVWDDLDGDGRQDAGEPNLENVTVNLLDVSNQVLATTTTDVDGLAVFNNLIGNTIYKTEIIKPSNSYVFATKNIGLNEAIDSDINRVTGISDFIIPTRGSELIMDIDAGLWSPGAIESYVWDDVDGDSRQDVNEVGLANITVELYDLSNNLLDTKPSDASGIVTFAALKADASYRLNYLLPSGYTLATKDNGSDLIDSDVSVSTGLSPIIRITGGNQVITNFDAGLYPPNSIIESYVWDDLDGDGRQDVNEPALENMLVELVSTTGTVVDTKVSDNSGSVSFSGLSSNVTYRLRFLLPQDYSFTTFKTSSKNLDSDANRTTGMTGRIHLLNGMNQIDDIDAGFWTPGYMESYLWIDVNEDGIQNSNETGMENVLVELRNASNNSLIDSSISDADGLVSFSNVPANRNLRLYVEEPIGYKPTILNSGTNDFIDSDIGVATGLTSVIKPLMGNQQYLSWDAGFRLDPSFSQIPINTQSLQVPLNKEFVELEFSFWPNPAKEMLRFDLGFQNGAGQLSMHTMNGMKIFEVDILEKATYHIEYLDKYNLSSGVYLLKYHNYNQATSQLVILNN